MDKYADEKGKKEVSQCHKNVAEVLSWNESADGEDGYVEEEAFEEVEVDEQDADEVEEVYVEQVLEEEQEFDDENNAEHSEDDLQGFKPRSSSNVVNKESERGYKPSSSEKRRSNDEPQGSVQKRQKHAEESRLEINSYSTSSGKENAGSSGKNKRSRWDKEPENSSAEHGDYLDTKTKKRKTRWANGEAQSKLLGPLRLPDFVKNLVGDISVDPAIEMLNSQLVEISHKLSALGPEDSSLRTSLIDNRQKIISELIKRNPTFKTPPDIKPSKLYKKLYIPTKEYPGYNFIGLIIGPCGNTRKRMEKATGAKIFLRGKGSTREGKIYKSTDTRNDLSQDEDLHVFIEASTQKSLDAAVEMVEKLLVPVEDEKNQHKRDQLRELAALKGTCIHDVGKAQKTKLPCHICGDEKHTTAACPLTASNPKTNKSLNFLADVGCIGASSLFHPPIPSSGSTVMTDQQAHALASPNKKPLEQNAEGNLYVCNLPQSINDDKLKELFSRFGCISKARVIKDKLTALSKGYGFVEFSDSVCAAAAVRCMNGYKIEGKTLAVKFARQHSSSASTSQVEPRVMTWPGPSGSMLPETSASVTARAPVSFGSPRPMPAVIRNTVTYSRELEQFPGYLKSNSPAITCSKELEDFPGYLKSAPFAITSSEKLEQFPGYLKGAPHAIISSKELEQFPGYLKSAPHAITSSKELEHFPGYPSARNAITSAEKLEQFPGYLKGAPNAIISPKELEQFPGYLKSAPHAIRSSKELEQFPSYLSARYAITYTEELEQFPGYLRSFEHD